MHTAKAMLATCVSVWTNEELWLNLYNDFKRNRLDRASKTDGHPGYLSQDRYVEMLLPLLKQKAQ